MSFPTSCTKTETPRAANGRRWGGTIRTPTCDRDAQYRFGPLAGHNSVCVVQSRRTSRSAPSLTLVPQGTSRHPGLVLQSCHIHYLQLPRRSKRWNCSPRGVDLGTRGLPTWMARGDGTDSNRVVLGERCHDDMLLSPEVLLHILVEVFEARGLTALVVYHSRLVSHPVPAPTHTANRSRGSAVLRQADLGSAVVASTLRTLL